MPFCSFSEGAAMFDVTPIENMFLLEYMPEARGDALRVYLYARMLCLHPELGDGVEAIARALGMEADDVLEAFKYWEQQGLVEKLSDRPPTYSIRTLHSRSFNAQAAIETNRYKELHNAVNRLFEGTDFVHQKQFSLLKDWIEDLHYTETAALRLLEFEMEQPGGKKPPAVFKRADKRAIEWSERGIRTLEDVENAIRYEGRIYSAASMVARQFNLNRRPTLPELKMVRGWIEDLGVSDEEILEACEKSTNARSPSFNYLNSILQKKREQDDSFEQVKALIQELGMIGARPAPAQLASYRQWLASGFEAETIFLAAAQCVQKDRHDFADLNWMLKEWGEAGVFSYARAQEYLAERQRVKSEAAEVLKRAGLKNEPGKIALSFYENWKTRFSVELISCAADFARGKGKYLEHMEKLLADWEKNGISTPDAAKARQEKAGGKAYSPQAANPVNFEQRSYTREESEKDYFDLEKFFAEEGNEV